jgi:hypothetical protein
VTCQKCHTVIPNLNDFGAHFLASGNRIPGVQPGPAFPLAAKVNLVGANVNQGSGDNGEGLPKAIVDEIEVFTAGAIGSRGSFFAEQYVVDGGTPGLLRDAWVGARLNPWDAKIPLYLQAGQATLPLPVDPETFRETTIHYAIFDQAIGNNPFNFFDPKLGTKLTIGDTLHGASAQLYAGSGYDRVSGLPKTGTDTMAYLAETMQPVTLSYYHYQGSRPDVQPALNHFTRNGYGLVYQRGKWTSETVMQTGFDSSFDGVGYASSGGFSQLRYAFDRRLFALARYEGTNDLNGFLRDGVLLVGYAPLRNARITLEEDFFNDPATPHTFSLQYTMGF